MSDTGKVLLPLAAIASIVAAPQLAAAFAGSGATTAAGVGSAAATGALAEGAAVADALGPSILSGAFGGLETLAPTAGVGTLPSLSPVASGIPPFPEIAAGAEALGRSAPLGFTSTELTTPGAFGVGPAAVPPAARPGVKEIFSEKGLNRLAIGLLAGQTLGGLLKGPATGFPRTPDVAGAGSFRGPTANAQLEALLAMQQRRRPAPRFV